MNKTEIINAIKEIYYFYINQEQKPILTVYYFFHLI